MMLLVKKSFYDLSTKKAGKSPAFFAFILNLLFMKLLFQKYRRFPRFPEWHFGVSKSDLKLIQDRCNVPLMLPPFSGACPKEMISAFSSCPKLYRCFALFRKNSLMVLLSTFSAACLKPFSASWVLSNSSFNLFDISTVYFIVSSSFRLWGCRLSTTTIHKLILLSEIPNDGKGLARV